MIHVFISNLFTQFFRLMCKKLERNPAYRHIESEVIVKIRGINLNKKKKENTKDEERKTFPIRLETNCKPVKWNENDGFIG